MPTLRTRAQQPNPVSPVVELPAQFPPIPQEIIDRFPDAESWQKRLNGFWTRTTQALQEAQSQITRQVNSQVIFSVDSFRIYGPNKTAQPMFSLDGTGVRLGDVLVVNTVGRTVHIGVGEYANDNTPFYVDTLGFFSLGANLTWNPETDTLTVTGTINATSGTIGGFDIGSDYIRDTANSFGLASTITGSNDVRFWAGETFANRATAPLRIYENGLLMIGNSASSTLRVGITNNADGLPAGLSDAQYLIHIGNTDGTAPGLMLDGSAAAGILSFRRAAGTVLAPTATLNGTLVGLIGSNGYGTTGFITQRPTEIRFLASENWTDTVWGSRMDFRVTAVGSGSLTTAARLDADGFNSTAIGTTTPSTGAFTTLSATGLITSALTGNIFNAQSATTQALYFRLQNTGGVTWYGLEDSTGGTFGATAYSYFIYTPTEFDVLIAGTKRAVVTSTGLAVTGALSATGTTSVGDGTASTNGLLVINGATTNAYGAAIRFSRGGTIKWQLGHESGILGNNSDAWLLYDQAAAANALKYTTATGLVVTGILSGAGVVRSTDGTIIMSILQDGASAYVGTQSNHDVVWIRNSTQIGVLTTTGINSCPIGATTPSTGAFTSLSATALAGVGTRNVVVDAAGVMSAP